MLVGALGVHVIDEALTGFLEFYNPLVLGIRSQISWFPMPTFTFAAWLTGLVVVVGLLTMLTPAITRGWSGTWFASWIFSAIMFMNALGHLAGSVYFQRWLPGATSSPLLFVASVMLARATWQRRRSRLRIVIAPPA